MRIKCKLIANGKNKLSVISDKIKEEKGKCSKYISVLQTIRLLEKKVPCGERIDDLFDKKISKSF